MGCSCRAGLVSAITALVLSILAIATPFWIILKYSLSDSLAIQGLFTARYGARKVQLNKGDAEKVAIAFHIMAEILLAACLAAMVFISRGYEAKMVKLAPVLSSGLAALFLLIAMSTYTGIYVSSLVGTELRFGYSYYLGWSSCGSGIGAAVALLRHKNDD